MDRHDSYRLGHLRCSLSLAAALVQHEIGGANPLGPTNTMCCTYQVVSRNRHESRGPVPEVVRAAEQASNLERF
jgi:hypothetical protein